METTIKTNSLAIVSFVSGLIAFLILGVLLLVGVTASPEDLPEPTNLIMEVSRSALDFCTFLSLLTGILALRDTLSLGRLDGTITLIVTLTEEESWGGWSFYTSH